MTRYLPTSIHASRDPVLNRGGSPHLDVVKCLYIIINRPWPLVTFLSFLYRTFFLLFDFLTIYRNNLCYFLAFLEELHFNFIPFYPVNSHPIEQLGGTPLIQFCAMEK